MRAAERIIQHLRQENALVDFQPVFLALRNAGFAYQVLLARHQPRILRRRPRTQRIHAHEPVARHGERVVDAARMGAHEACAGLAREREDFGRGGRFPGIALRPGGQAREQFRRALPEMTESGLVGGDLRGPRGSRARPTFYRLFEDVVGHVQ